MSASERFISAGWTILYRLKTVAVKSKNGIIYHVCNKYHGGGNYSRELTISWNKAVKQGLI